jgi:hypothetical protein
MASRFNDEDNTDKVSEGIQKMLDNYDSDEDKIVVSDSEEKSEEIQYRGNVWLNKNEDDEHISPLHVREMDMKKISERMAQIFRVQREKPKNESYIAKVFDIVMTNIFIVLYLVLSEDMVKPAETFIRERVCNKFMEEVDIMRVENPWMYQSMLVISVIFYYMYKFRLPMAFISGFIWGAILL